MNSIGSVLGVLLWLTHGSAAQEQVLVAGRDVPVPKKVQHRAPLYPPIAREAHVAGVVLLAVTLNTEGYPTDIKVLRAIPLLDLAAVEAVKTWRYEPTLLNDVPRRVVLLEAITFPGADREVVQTWAPIATDQELQSSVRIYAIARLQELPPKKYKVVRKTLQKLLGDHDATVAQAAERALATLTLEAK